MSYREGTGALVSRVSARISARVLEILDTAAPTYFDDCYVESASLQGQIEDAVKLSIDQATDELRTVYPLVVTPPPQKRTKERA